MNRLNSSNNLPNDHSRLISFLIKEFEQEMNRYSLFIILFGIFLGYQFIVYYFQNLLNVYILKVCFKYLMKALSTTNILALIFNCLACFLKWVVRTDISFIKCMYHSFSDFIEPIP